MIYALFSVPEIVENVQVLSFVENVLKFLSIISINDLILINSFLLWLIFHIDLMRVHENV